MLIRLGLALIVSLATCSCTTQSVAPASTAVVHSVGPDQQDLHAILEPIVTKTKVPGLAAIVLQGDKIVAQGVAGVRKRKHTESITIDDRFLLCSGGKAMTATLAAVAVEEGKLSWNTTLGEIFGDKIRGMHPAWKPVTVAQLLEHRAGVPTDGALFWSVAKLHFSRRSEQEKRQAIIEKVLRKAPPHLPGTRYVYASIDYVMVGAMLEKISGQAWESLIKAKLWEPLNMTSGGFGVPGTHGKIDQPWSHWGMIVTGHPAGPAASGPISPLHFSGPQLARQI
ncbi:MAG: serine hydrolase domain-containing protein [Nibricoccus sp.]